MTGLVTHNKLRSSSLVGCEVVCVLSEGREEAFSQNPKSISSSESDSECWGSGAGRVRDVQISLTDNCTIDNYSKGESTNSENLIGPSKPTKILPKGC